MNNVTKKIVALIALMAVSSNSLVYGATTTTTTTTSSPSTGGRRAPKTKQEIEARKQQHEQEIQNLNARIEKLATTHNDQMKRGQKNKQALVDELMDISTTMDKSLDDGIEKIKDINKNLNLYLAQKDKELAKFKQIINDLENNHTKMIEKSKQEEITSEENSAIITELEFELDDAALQINLLQKLLANTEQARAEVSEAFENYKKGPVENATSNARAVKNKSDTLNTEITQLQHKIAQLKNSVAVEE